MDHSTRPNRRQLSRRKFLALGGGALAVTAGASLLPGAAMARPATNSVVLSPASSGAAAPAAVPPINRNIHLAGTDGWVSLPAGASSPFYPDGLAPSPFNTYVFGFRNVTALTSSQILAQKGKAQVSAPILFANEGDNVRITLTNLGLQQRPDLADSHTIHWHGFQNAIPLFDGVPEMSIAVPIGRDFTYFYHPRDPGTYMYHCHFEDVEHVQMGMTGVVYVRPALNTSSARYVYNDTSTQYNREFTMFLTEISLEAHYDDAHIQVFDWSEFKADYRTLNGRAYPDTIAPGFDPMVVPAAPYQHLQYQPISSLVAAKPNEKVLLRFVNLGYEQQAMTLGGIPMRVVGRDAMLLKNGSTDNSYLTNTIYIGPGESYDAIFTAPAYSGANGSNGYDTYLLYNRKYAALNNGGAGCYGGQMTEVRIYAPSSSLQAQDIDQPNTNPGI